MSKTFIRTSIEQSTQAAIYRCCRWNRSYFPPSKSRVGVVRLSMNEKPTWTCLCQQGSSSLIWFRSLVVAGWPSSAFDCCEPNWAATKSLNMLTDVVAVQSFESYGFACYGLFAKTDLDEGTLIWEAATPLETFTRTEILSHPESSQLIKYSYMVDNDKYGSTVDPRKSSLSYYFNHSCNPNCWYDTDDRITTMRPIKQGEQLTYDYAFTETESSLHYGMTCRCGSSDCRKVLTFDQWRSRSFIKRYHGHITDFIWRKHSENSWYDPRLELRYKPEGELGLFCRDIAGMEIAENEIVLVFSGKVVHQSQLLEEDALSARDLQMSLQVERELLQIPAWKESNDYSETTDYVNHSCDPSCGMLDSVTVVALRNIGIGEEITIDYSMVNDGLLKGPSDNFACRCGATICRKSISSSDWQIPELQKRYKNRFSPFLRQMIKDGQQCLNPENIDENCSRNTV